MGADEVPDGIQALPAATLDDLVDGPVASCMWSVDATVSEVAENAKKLYLEGAAKQDGNVWDDIVQQAEAQAGDIANKLGLDSSQQDLLHLLGGIFAFLT